MDPIIGQLMIVAFNFAPQNWLLCDGTTYAVSQYEALFNLIGNKYGGDGVNNFCVPDLRGRFPMGQGAGNGLSPIALGQIGGTATITPRSHRQMSALALRQLPIPIQQLRKIIYLPIWLLTTSFVGMAAIQLKAIRNLKMEPFTGQIILTALAFAPYGWAFCDGSTLLISQNEELYALIGPNYGGDGISNFQRHDLRGGRGSNPVNTFN
jgi:microcystin-dependent protein